MKKQNLKNQSMSTDITDVTDVTKKNPVEITIDLRGNGATPPPTHYRYIILCSPGQEVVADIVTKPLVDLPMEVKGLTAEDRINLIAILSHAEDADDITSVVVGLVRDRKLGRSESYSTAFLTKLLRLCRKNDFSLRTLQRHINSYFEKLDI